ncbi:MAG: hypothetical protein AAGC63_01025 [Propionicimonas sp.]|nr:hypothetical protein [Propionicimonas sp.]
MSDTTGPDIARLTYGYLRWLLICLPALLFAVTMLTALGSGELETSISAFYGGPVRDVFVGAMFAIAACLVAYQGVGLLEDYALNGAGFYAVFVALVPTGFAGLMDDLRANPSPDGATPADHVAYLRIALTGVVVLCGVLFARELASGRLRQLVVAPAGTSTPARWVNRVFLLLTALLLVGFLSLAMGQLWGVPAEEVTMAGISLGPVQLAIHDLAAIFLIASLAVAVLTNTWPFYRFGDLWSAGRFFYLVVFALMTIGALVPVAVAAAFAPDHLVILIEWWEIALFALFWALETRREARQASGRLDDDASPGPLHQPRRGTGPERSAERVPGRPDAGLSGPAAR